MMLNGGLASFYICIGTFDGLVTFVGKLPKKITHNQEKLAKSPAAHLLVLPKTSYLTIDTGISAYLFFFLAVLGLYKIRRDDGDPNSASYRTWTMNPCIFGVVSGLLVLRGVISDPLQGAAIALLFVAGWAIFQRRFRAERA